MAGLDCAQVSAAAWPTLRDGIHAAVTIEDAEVYAAMRELAGVGLVVGESGAAPLAALRVLVGAAGCAALGAAVGLGSATRALLVATEGPSWIRRPTTASSRRTCPRTADPRRNKGLAPPHRRAPPAASQGGMDQAHHRSGTSRAGLELGGVGHDHVLGCHRIGRDARFRLTRRSRVQPPLF